MRNSLAIEIIEKNKTNYLGNVWNIEASKSRISLEPKRNQENPFEQSKSDPNALIILWSGWKSTQIG
jgi:hypothetical protein